MLTLSALPAVEQPHVTIGWRTRRAAAWAFDLDAIERAHAALELTLPVVIGHVEYGGEHGHTHGRHIVVGEGSAHRISVRRTCPAHAASGTIWHELAHALQAERSGDPAGFYAGPYRCAMLGRRGYAAYYSNRFEVAARTFEPRGRREPLVIA